MTSFKAHCPLVLRTREAFIVWWIWDPLCGASLIQPMVRRLRARQIVVQARAMRVQKKV